ncbi:MAG: hypothetical protein ACRDBL_08830 [Rhabdaerophilum sp.]
MNTTMYSDALLPLSGTESEKQPKRNLIARLFDAIAASNAAKAEREIRRIEKAYGISLRVESPKISAAQTDLPFSNKD